MKGDDLPLLHQYKYKEKQHERRQEIYDSKRCTGCTWNLKVQGLWNNQGAQRRVERERIPGGKGKDQQSLF